MTPDGRATDGETRERPLHERSSQGLGMGEPYKTSGITLQEVYRTATERTKGLTLHGKKSLERGLAWGLGCKRFLTDDSREI